MKVNGPEIKPSFLVILLFVKAYFVQLQWQIIECQKRPVSMPILVGRGQGIV